MALLTRDQIVGELGALLGVDTTSGSEGETTLIRCLNWGQRRVHTARFWYERRAIVQVLTAAPYSTGTCDFTNASTAVTGHGTTWTTGMTGYKMGTGLDSPPYRFTRTGNTTGTILPSTGYAETTALLSKYSLYQDEFDIATDVDDIYECMLLRQEYGGAMTKVSESGMNQGRLVHGITGFPMSYCMTGSQTAGTKRIRVFPIPDAAYRMEIRYWTTATDYAAGSTTTALGANKEYLVLKAAALYAQSISDVQKITSEQEVSALIEQAWREQQDNVPIAYTKRGYDAGGGRGGLWFNDSTLDFG